MVTMINHFLHFCQWKYIKCMCLHIMYQIQADIFNRTEDIQIWNFKHCLKLEKSERCTICNIFLNILFGIVDLRISNSYQHVCLTLLVKCMIKYNTFQKQSLSEITIICVPFNPKAIVLKWGYGYCFDNLTLLPSFNFHEIPHTT